MAAPVSRARHSSSGSQPRSRYSVAGKPLDQSTVLSSASRLPRRIGDGAATSYAQRATRYADARAVRRPHGPCERSPWLARGYSQPCSSFSASSSRNAMCGVAVVEAGDVGELLAAGMLEDLAVLDLDLLQRLQAVGGEGRRDHRHLLDAAPRQRLHGLVEIGLQPFLAAEARLEADHHPLGRPAQLLAHQPRRLLAVAMIGVAAEQQALGHAVVGEHDAGPGSQSSPARCGRMLSASAAM